jgi:hypothetical protein
MLAFPSRITRLQVPVRIWSKLPFTSAAWCTQIPNTERLPVLPETTAASRSGESEQPLDERWERRQPSGPPLSAKVSSQQFVLRRNGDQLCFFFYLPPEICLWLLYFAVCLFCNPLSVLFLRGVSRFQATGHWQKCNSNFLLSLSELSCWFSGSIGIHDHIFVLHNGACSVTTEGVVTATEMLNVIVL